MSQYDQTDIPNIVSMSCGSTQSIAVLNNGCLFGFGDGSMGQYVFFLVGKFTSRFISRTRLFDGITGKMTLFPHPLALEHLTQSPCIGWSFWRLVFLFTVLAGVACGSRHSLAWTLDGHVLTCGSNFNAQLSYDYSEAEYRSNHVCHCSFQVAQIFRLGFLGFSKDDDDIADAHTCCDGCYWISSLSLLVCRRFCR